MPSNSAPQAASKPSALYPAILKGITFGWSMIPLYAKDAPAVDWKIHQAELPTPEDLAIWFDHPPQYSAYGVICGQVSQLVVIDFDKQSSADEFVKRFSHLTKTRMVLSANRQLPHYYFKVTYPVATKAILGGEVRGEGAYVVGAGSVIDGKTWQLLNDVEPLYLHRTELDQILTVFNKSTIEPANYISHTYYSFPAYPAYDSTPAPAKPTAPITPAAPEPVIEVPPITPAPPLLTKTCAELQGIYRHEAQRTGQRNNALFFVARLARDNGYPEARTVDLLAQLHAQMPALDGQPYEAEARRYGEAVRTIASAYTRPAVARDNTPKRRASYLPNVLRDFILNLPRGTAVLRTWEALLLLEDAFDGAWFTESEAVEALQGIVGKGSIEYALHFDLPDGNGLFKRQSNFSRYLRPNKNSIFIQPQGAEGLPTPLGEGSGRSGGRREKSGRPEHYYQLPNVQALCQALELVPAGSEPIYMEDVQSRKAYREALVRGMVARKPIKYEKDWLANRLGVCKRTIGYYHQDLDIQSVPSYSEILISWYNLDKLAWTKEETIPGQFLRDENGENYPAIRPVARKLLKQGHRLALMRQEGNIYYLGETPDWLDLQMAQAGYAQRTWQSVAEAENSTISASKFTTSQMPQPPSVQVSQPTLAEAKSPSVNDSTPSAEAVAAPLVVKETVYIKRLENVAKTKPCAKASDGVPDYILLPKEQPHEFFRQPLPQWFEEKIAQEVHTKIPAVSLANARRWVYWFGVERVIPALGYTEWYIQHRDTTNPAGLLRKRIEREWEIQHGFKHIKPIVVGQSKQHSKPPKERRSQCVKESGVVEYSDTQYRVHPQYGTISTTHLYPTEIID